jgi:predicted enzyme related to lactoylglutathione lyase
MFSVELHTSDVARLAEFYRDVIGVDIGPGDDDATHFETFWGEWGSESKDPFFFFAIQPLDASGVATTGLELGLDVTDLEAVHARVVAAGGDVVEPIADKPWGRAASYRDPQGNTVQLTES